MESLLEFDGRKPRPWSPEAFRLTTGESPQDLEEWVRAKADHGHTARLSAGFCWPWSDPVDGHLVDDVVIDGWQRPWNAKPGKKVVDAPSASLWASDPRGVGQVGCIYTAQGFEYDYAGVIFGPDLIRRDGAWVSNPEASRDNVVRRDKEAFDQLIRQTYKVLLTRGLVGARLYSTDPETREFLAELVAGD